MKIRSISPNEPDGRTVDIDGIKYKFRPDGENGNVCEVSEKEHARKFLAISEGYEPADPTLKSTVKAAPKALPPRTTGDPFAGEPKTVMVDGERVPTDAETAASGDNGDTEVPVPKKRPATKAPTKLKAKKL